jgi:P-type Cu+ transporter
MSEGDNKTLKAVFVVRGADCVTCALAIERRIKKLDGVRDVKSSIMLNEVFVYYDETKVDISKITEEIRKTGYSNHLVRRAS